MLAMVASMASQRAGRPRSGDARPVVAERPTDAEARALAGRLVREHHRPAAVSPGDRLSAQEHELAPADGRRVEAALAALAALASLAARAALDPGDTPRAAPETAGAREDPDGA
jgi:hypothetical protein